jgi:hypothetical protein
MATIQITKSLELALEEAAHHAGVTKDELAQDILAANFELEDESLPLSAFTEAQLERMKHSVEQLNRGDVVTSEEVDKRFEALFARLAAR